MERMKLKISPLARMQMKDVRRFYAKSFSLSVAANVYTSLLDTFHLMCIQPSIGAIEPLLEEYPQSFRSFVQHRNLKIVYWTEDNMIKVALIFDTRQKPEKLPYIVRNNSSWVCEEPTFYGKPMESALNVE